MITKRQIERINELARKAKEGELTPREKEEQSRLRRLYIDSYKENLRSQLDSIRVLDPKTGEKTSLRKKPNRGRDPKKS